MQQLRIAYKKHFAKYESRAINRRKKIALPSKQQEDSVCLRMERISEVWIWYPAAECAVTADPMHFKC